MSLSVPNQEPDARFSTQSVYWGFIIKHELWNHWPHDVTELNLYLLLSPPQDVRYQMTQGPSFLISWLIFQPQPAHPETI